MGGIFMCKRKRTFKVTEKFKGEDINKRKEVLEKLLYNIVRNKEKSSYK
jgi:hypothetical protein